MNSGQVLARRTIMEREFPEKLMRRWNGWGEASVEVPVPEPALAFLRDSIGPGSPPKDASFERVLAAIPAGRLPEFPMGNSTPAVRLLHARGQSLPDWLALRFGCIGRLPDAVAFPESAAEVRELLHWAGGAGARIIPYGGGTSVVGHITPPADDALVVTVSLAHLRRLLAFDADSRLATFGSGVTGPDLEAQLRIYGCTLGHFPQSFEYSTLGGWIATRSSGQQSRRYGRIEQMFAGASVETPAGSLVVPVFPASAAGLDLRETVLGSEGRLGIITEATVRVSPLPEHESFHGWFFADWETGELAARSLAHSDVQLSMLRLSNAAETSTMLQLAGRASGMAWLNRYLALRGCGSEKTLLLAGVTGSSPACRRALSQAQHWCRRRRGVYLGTLVGDGWEKNRFRSVYLRNALWQHGYAVDTLETAVCWPRVRSTMVSIETALRQALSEEPIHVYAHLSHLYPQGSSIYVTYVYRLTHDYDTNLDRWRRLKHAASRAIVAAGGTISHQHGVGIDHAPYLAAEKGELGLGAMRAVFRTFDPDGLMNPGKLC